MEIIEQTKDFIKLRLANGDEIDIQNAYDSIIISADPPMVIDTKKVTGIYVQIGVMDAAKLANP